MTKKVLRVGFCFLLMFLISMPIYAKENQNSKDVEFYGNSSQYVTSNDTFAKVVKIARGRLISSSGLQISDEGNGVLGVYAETLCHSRMKDIYMTIYLDMWDETRKDWITLDDYEYAWSASGQQGKDLTDVSVSFDVVGLQRGRKYCLRSNHVARDFNLNSESMTIDTEAITLK